MKQERLKFADEECEKRLGTQPSQTLTSELWLRGVRKGPI